MRFKRIFVSLAFCFIIIISIAAIPDEGVVSADPMASFTYSFSPKVGEEIRFDATGSIGVGLLNYSWDFGDGDHDEGAIVFHIFQDSGYYEVTLEVEDSFGDRDWARKTIYVSSDIDPTPALVGFGVVMIIYIVMIAGAFILYFTNPILGGILAYKGYKKAKEMGLSKVATPYMIAHAVTGGVSLIMYWFVIFSIIGHIVIYFLLKNKLNEVSEAPPMNIPPYVPPNPQNYPPLGQQAMPPQGPPPYRPPQAPTQRPMGAQPPPHQAPPPPQTVNRPPPAQPGVPQRPPS